MPANPFKQAPVQPDGVMGNTLMSTSEAAAFLCVSEDTLHSWRHRRVGPPWVMLDSQRGGRPIARYRLADIVALVMARLQVMDRPVKTRSGPLMHKGIVKLPEQEGRRLKREALRAKHNLRKGRRRAERKAAGEGKAGQG